MCGVLLVFVLLRYALSLPFSVRVQRSSAAFTCAANVQSVDGVGVCSANVLSVDGVAVWRWCAAFCLSSFCFVMLSRCRSAFAYSVRVRLSHAEVLGPETRGQEAPDPRSSVTKAPGLEATGVEELGRG